MLRTLALKGRSAWTKPWQGATRSFATQPGNPLVVAGVSSHGCDEESIRALFVPLMALSALSAWTMATKTRCDAASEQDAEDDSNFQLMVALDAKEEMEKVRLAQIINDLHELAQEERGLKRFVTMVRRASKVFRRSEDEAIGEDDQTASACPEIGDTISLEGVDLTSLPTEHAERLLEGIHAGSHFDIAGLQQLLLHSMHLLRKEPNLIDISKRPEIVTVVGDLHGSLDSLTHILTLMLPKIRDDKSHIICFNGDFVDRGQKSLEVLETLLVLKLAFPDQVYLIRGNHEDTSVASVYGFQDQVRREYGDKNALKLWDSLGKLFAALPLAVKTRTSLVVHGGLPDLTFDLNHLKRIPPKTRFEMNTVVTAKSDDGKFLSGILWSDPTNKQEMSGSQNPRGVGILFGPESAQNFLERNNLQQLIRGHEVVANGVKDMKCGSNKSVITVFSAAAYSGQNKGAVLHLEPSGKYEYESYSIQECSKSSDQAMNETIENAMDKVRSMIANNRSKLEKAFARVQSFGKVTAAQWVEVMSETIESAGMPWSTLQPSLAPTSLMHPLIDVESFLREHSLRLHDSNIDSLEAETLAENHEMLLTVFKFLDTNGDGTLSPKEFETGVRLLNRRLPEERQLKNPHEMFKILDADGNGEISFEEFTSGFGLS